MHLPAFGIRSRLLLLGVVPAVAILTGVLGMNFLRMRSLLLGFGEEILVDRVKMIAADIDRGTLEAVTAARVMAMAAENGLLGRRLDALRLARDVLESYPQFTGAYFGYEPNADGSAATEGETVVVDGRDTLSVSLRDHRGSRGAVEVHEHEDVDARGEHLISDGGELRLVTVGVLDVVLDASRLEGLLEERTIRGLPTRRGGGIGQDHADLGRDGRGSRLRGAALGSRSRGTALGGGCGAGRCGVATAAATGGKEETSGGKAGDGSESALGHLGPFSAGRPCMCRILPCGCALRGRAVR